MNALTSALRILGQHEPELTHRKPVTFDSMHTVTLSVHDWMAIECAMAQGRLNSLDHGWTETAKLQSELLERLDAQVREQIDGAGEAEETEQ